MFDWTEEQALLQKTTADFAQKELAPKAANVDETEGWNAEAFKKMASLGLLGITVAEEYGGAELGSLEASLVMEKFAEACASTTLSYLAHSMLFVNNLHANGSAEQKKRYLPKAVSGEWITGMGMTEPQAGSDALNLQTKAVKKGDKYVLNGSKTMITNAPVGNAFLVYARTGPSKKDISTFIVEKSFPGFRAGKKLHKMGMRGSPTGELIFEQCEVPVENLIGKENDSVTHMMKNLNIERTTISGISLGIAAATLAYVRQYSEQRHQFGAPISSFQMVQEKIANMATHLDAGRALVYTAARAYDRGENSMSLGAKAKLFTAPMGTAAALDGIQILGGWGYMKEYPVERYMRDAKLLELGAGTNEVMRLIVAKDLLDIK
jgi:isovaleryl-CoA dehydrogenase